jgi:excinuclease ABC subunit A
MKANYMPYNNNSCNKCYKKYYINKFLNIKYKNKNIQEILNMSIYEIFNFFNYLSNKLQHIIKLLLKLGLGYLKLNQYLCCLSTGEQVKLHLIHEIHSNYTLQNVLYIFDELNFNMHLKDVNYLINLFEYLICKGHTIILIGHESKVINYVSNIIKLYKYDNNIKTLNCVN